MDLVKTRKKLNDGKSIFELPLRVAYYARVSSDTDVQLNSLDNQITYFDEFIKSNKNWTFIGGYVDEGLSGASVKKRDDFKRMITDGEDGRFDLIITKEISRFARDTLDSIQYTRQLLSCNVGVFFQADNICTLYPDSELRLTIMASLAQDELRRLSERVKFGMKQAHKSGKVLGQDNMYGYRKTKGKLTIVEKEAEFIRELFNLYAEDKYGFRVLTRMLTEKGYRNQAGGELNPGSMKSILANPKYKGYYHGHITESNDYREQKKVKTAPEERILYKSDEVPAIVPEELWNKVNDILAKRTEKYGNIGYGSPARFVYSGKIICEEHNTHHYRKVWKDRKVPTESWCCKHYLAKGRKECATPHLYTRDIDAILEHIGNDLLSNREKYVTSVDELLAIYARADGGSTDYASDITKQLNAIKKNKHKQDKLLELYTDDEIDKAEYLDKNNRLKADTEKRNQEIAMLKAEHEQANSGITGLNKVREFLTNLSDEGAGALQVAQEMLENIVILKGSKKTEIKIRISMRFGDIIPCTIIKLGQTEISPLVGNEKQSEDLITYINQEMTEDPGRIWELNMFGKSMHEMVRDGLQNKLFRMPETAQMKFQETLQKIINEGSGGLICIIL